MSLAAAAMPLLRRLDPETAHALSLAGLRWGLGGRERAADDPRLAVTAFGRRLGNPIGLAAGFDKNGVAIDALGRLGFGFVEVGSVTPLPQAGNARPRLFRLTEDRAVINRMGFNNDGIAALLPRLRRADRARIAIGANLGINKEGARPEVDYPALVRAVEAQVDYITLNISSPNTKGLRELQGAGALGRILDEIETKIPVFVKIAPDLSEDGLAALVETCLTRAVAGLIVGNTTLARPETLRGAGKTEAGGLSGAPLFAASTRMLAKAHRLAQGKLLLIGVGGVFSGEDVFAKILAGASLVQLYTAFAYHGPALLPRLKRELAGLLSRNGLASVAQATGAGV